MTEWRAIETAPKDGTPALYLSPEGHVGIGIIETSDYGDGYLSIHGCGAWCGRREYQSRDAVWIGGYSPTDATHWMPLPPLPAGARTKADFKTVLKTAEQPGGETE